MKRKFPRIIFFINGPVPTDEEYDAALELGMNVTFRNAQHIAADGCLEECDGVASLNGELPERYADHKSADDALREFSQSFRRKAGVPEGEGKLSSIEEARAALEAEAAKGKGKVGAQSAATSQISTLENSNKVPAPPEIAPEWKPNA